MKVMPKSCPIDMTLSHIGKKWMISIIRDLFMGSKRFSDFLKRNKDLSTKMLSLRLRELEEEGMIQKEVVSTTPLIAEYKLTERGRALGKILYELSVYAFEQYSKELLHHPSHKKEVIAYAKKAFVQNL